MVVVAANRKIRSLGWFRIGRSSFFFPRDLFLVRGFQLALALVDTLLKFADALTDAMKQFGDLLATKQDEDDHQDDDQFLAAERPCEKVRDILKSHWRFLVGRSPIGIIRPARRRVHF